jgi:hypothetical protein
VTDPGTIFRNRYVFQEEKPIVEGRCPDCGTHWSIVIRSYIDLESENGKGRVETSVRTACLCAEEIDPYRVEPKAVFRLTGGSAPWRKER